MAERKTTEVVAHPVSGQPGQAYSYFQPGRILGSPLEGLARGLASLQPGLQAMIDREQAELERQGQKDALAGRGRQRNDNAYVQGYDNIKGQRALTDFQGDLTTLFETAKTEGWDKDKWSEQYSDLFAQYTVGMPNNYLDKFVDPAFGMLGKANGLFMKELGEQVRQDLLTDTSVIARKQIEGVLNGGVTEGNPKAMRKQLDFLRGNAKKTGLNTSLVTGQYLSIAAEMAELEGRPDLLEFIFEKDPSGIKVVDTEHQKDAVNAYTRAIAAKHRLEAAKETAKNKLYNKQQTFIANQFLLRLSEVNSTDVKGMALLRRELANYATENNPQGVMLEFSTLNTLEGVLDRMEKLNGFPETSNMAIYQDLYIKTARGQMSWAELDAKMDFLKEEDVRELMKKQADYKVKEEDKSFKAWEKDEGEELRRVIGVVDQADPITGTKLDPLHGPRRARLVQYLWKRWLADYQTTNQGAYPSLDEMYDKGTKLIDESFKRYPPRVQMGNAGDKPLDTSPEAEKERRKRLRGVGTQKETPPKKE